MAVSDAAGQGDGSPGSPCSLGLRVSGGAGPSDAELWLECHATSLICVTVPSAAPGGGQRRHRFPGDHTDAYLIRLDRLFGRSSNL